MSHRSVLKQKNKPHKSGHSKKNPFKTIGSNSPGPGSPSLIGQKDRRKNDANLQRKSKNSRIVDQKLVGTKDGPPKTIALLPVSESVDPDQFFNIWTFNQIGTSAIPSGELVGGQFKCIITPIIVQRNFDSVIEAGRIADIIVLLFKNGETVDAFGERAVKIIKALGVPPMMALILEQSGEEVTTATINEYKKFIHQELPDVDRVLPVATVEDYNQFVRFISVTTPKSPAWREKRPCMLIQDYSINDDFTIDVQGFLRNAPLLPHQLVTIPCIGDFRIESINDIPANSQLADEWIISADDVINPEADVKPPQSVEFDSLGGGQIASDFEKINLGPQQEYEEETQEEIEKDEQEAGQIYRRSEEELEFPDEFDYDNNISLRERLSKYRGLKSFNESHWDKNEGLPEFYSKIFQFTNIQRLSEAAINECQSWLKEEMAKAPEEQYQEPNQLFPGNLLKIKLSCAKYNSDNLIIEESLKQFHTFSACAGNHNLTLVGLFRYETRLTVWNCTFKNFGDTLVSKKERILCVSGLRQMWVNPIFSEDTRANKHLLKRKVPAGEMVIASFVAPSMMETCSLLYFKEVEGEMVMVGTGSLKTIDPTRLIIRQKILTGNPYRTLGRNARVTMMFFNKEDVMWFSSVGLWTKNKRRGNIESAIGLNGHFKCTFNDIVKPEDTVCMSLYKRVFPQPATEPFEYTA